MLSAKVEMCFKTRPLVCSVSFEGLVSELRARDGVTQGACMIFNLEISGNLVLVNKRKKKE